MHEVMLLIMRYVRGTWRYRWWLLGLAWAICLVGWTIVARLPDQYQASARVYVDTSSILRPYLAGLAINTGNNQRKIFLMTRTLLSRPNLEKVLRMTDLDLRADTEAEKDALLDEVKKNLRFGGTRRENLYTISYNDDSPELAKLVVKSLLTIFMEGNLGEARKDQDSARQFLQQQKEDYERHMRDLEEKRASFREKNLALLANESGGYYSRLRQAKKQLEDSRLELSVAEERLDTLRRQVEGEEPSFGLGPKLGRSTQVQIDTGDIDRRVQAMELSLDSLLVKYTERHPDVMATKRAINDLKAERSSFVAEAKKNHVPGDNAGAGYDVNQNPVYQQMRLSLANAETDVSVKRKLLKQYEVKYTDLEGNVDQVLELESEQRELERDYRLTKKNQASLLSRMESAKLGRKADDSAESVRFRVIDPPRAPVRPSGPNRVLFSTGVLLAALSIGLALAFLMSQFRPTYDERQMMSDDLGLPVLGSVNMVWTSGQIRARKVRNASFVFGLTALLAIFAAVLVMYQFDIDLLPRLAKSLKLT